MKRKSRAALFVATGGLSEAAKVASVLPKAAVAASGKVQGRDASGPSANSPANTESSSHSDEPARAIAELAKTQIPGFMKGSYELRKELRKLPELLIGDEEVLNLAAGEHTGKRGLLAVTNRRVLFLDEGMVRHALDDYPYTQITSVESGTRMVRGHVVIYTAGKKASIKDVYPKERAVEIADYIRLQIGRVTAGPVVEPQASSPAVAAAPPSPDVYEQLEKLGQLRDRGVLTVEEFDAKKSELLARM